MTVINLVSELGVVPMHGSVTDEVHEVFCFSCVHCSHFLFQSCMDHSLILLIMDTFCV